MFALTVTLVLSAAPVSLALPGLTPVNIAPQEADYYGELLSEDLGKLGLKVITGRDITTMLGIERQKQLMGCSEDSCITELVGALGADGMVTGDVGKVGAEYVLNLKVIKPNGATLALHNGRAERAEAMRDTLSSAARSVAHQLAQAMSRPELEPPALAAAPPSLRLWTLAPAALAVVGFGAGVGLQLGASGQYTTLVNATYPKEARDAKSTGQSMELFGNVALAVGSAALVAAIVWFFYSAPAEAQP